MIIQENEGFKPMATRIQNKAREIRQNIASLIKEYTPEDGDAIDLNKFFKVNALNAPKDKDTLTLMNSYNDILETQAAQIAPLITKFFQQKEAYFLRDTYSRQRTRKNRPQKQETQSNSAPLKGMAALLKRSDEPLLHASKIKYKHPRIRKTSEPLPEENRLDKAYEPLVNTLRRVVMERPNLPVIDKDGTYTGDIFQVKGDICPGKTPEDAKEALAKIFSAANDVIDPENNIGVVSYSQEDGQVTMRIIPQTTTALTLEAA